MDPLTIALLVGMVGGTSLQLYKGKREKDKSKKMFKAQKEILRKKVGRVEQLRSTALGLSNQKQAAKGRSGGIAKRTQERVRRPYDWQIEDINDSIRMMKKGQPSRNMQYLDYGIAGLSALSGAAGGLSSLSGSTTPQQDYGSPNLQPDSFGVPSADYDPGYVPSASAPGMSTSDYYRQLYGTGVQRGRY